MEKLAARFAKYGIVCLSLMYFTSCATWKKIVYFQDADQVMKSDTANKQGDTAVLENVLRIQPFDVLDIKVNSALKALDILTESQQKAFIAGTIQDNYFTGFLVDQNGNVNLPLVGMVHLAGLTINDAKKVIFDKMKEFLNDPFVDIKFLTFRVTVLGEVKRPGEIVVPNEKANLIQALSLAGDLSDYGNSTKITVLRGNPAHPAAVYHMDMTKIASLSSDGFKIMPNDIIYVEPLKRKLLVMNVTSLVAISTFLNTLVLVSNQFRK